MVVLYLEYLCLFFPPPTIYLDVKEPKRTDDAYQLEKNVYIGTSFCVKFGIDVNSS